VWNGTAFVSWADADIGDYDIPLTSLGGDLYANNFPSAITTTIEYRVLYYEQAGASPATDDLLLASEEGYWDGTGLVKNLSTSSIATSTTVFDDLTTLYATTDDVIALLPRNITRVLNQRNRSSQPNISLSDIEDYIRRAEATIDGELEDLYVVPLIRIKEVDRRVKAGSTSYVYPDPIPFVCQRLAAALIYNERFTGDASNIDGSVYGDRYILHEAPPSLPGEAKPKPQKIAQVRRYDVFPVKRLTSKEDVDGYLDGIRKKLYDTLEANDGIQIN